MIVFKSRWNRARGAALTICAAIASLACIPGLATAHVGDQSFLDAAHKAWVETPQFQEAKSAQEKGVAIKNFSNVLSFVKNTANLSLLPTGTLCDSATLEDGRLTVRFTFPADELTTLSIDQADNTAAVFEYYFAVSEGLTEISLLARVGTSGEWRPLQDFVPMPSASALETETVPVAKGPGPQPAPDYKALIDKSTGGYGPTGSSSEPAGALSGRTVFLSQGHGWFYTGSSWSLQRPLLFGMNEDYGNIDNVNILVKYLFNAGATVVPLRPVGNQNNEVVMHDTSAGVVFDPPLAWTTNNDNYNFGGFNASARFAVATPTEAATATFTPTIPEAGYYPVYGWANHGSDRISGQLYRIRHAGGEARVRVNHRRVGRGWVYLGEYYFNSGTNSLLGSVIVSNEAPAAGTTSGIVVADAIRFGNGMGSFNYGGGVSGYPRQDENAYEWTSLMQSTGSAGSAGSYMPSVAADMRRDDGQGYNGDIYLSWHSNAAGCAGGPPCAARGCIGLTNNNSPSLPNQVAFATLLSDVTDEFCLVEDTNWEFPWIDRPQKILSGGYSEISHSSIGGEMCASLIEVAFHDNDIDAKLLRDPRVRNVVARASYASILKYFNQFDSNPYTLLPDAPTRVRARSDASGNVTVSWAPVLQRLPIAHAATGYRVYSSTDGIAFGNPTVVSGAATSSVIIPGIPEGQTTYFRVAAINSGGESMPSEVIASRARGSLSTAPVLVVTGYDRHDRFNNIPMNVAAPDTTNNERIFAHRNNSYDYVRQHGQAIAAAGAYFDSTSNEAVAQGDVDLTDYYTVIWALGEESIKDEPFSLQERQALESYITRGGGLLVSGSEVGSVLAGTPAQAPAFYTNSLQSTFVGDDAGTYQAQGVASTVFAGLAFDFSPTSSMYNVDAPDQLNPGPGSPAVVSAHYNGGSGGTAAIQYEGQNFWLINMGFPFEAINSPTIRNQAMAAALDFLVRTPPASAADWSLFH